MEKTTQCVVICLNKERQRCVERQMKNLGITFPVHYMEASVPETMESYFPRNTSLRDKQLMCCALSHNRAIQYASQDTSTDFTVIIEDDVGLHKTEFERTVKELANRWSEITAQEKHSVALGWIPEHNYNNYFIHANGYTKLKTTNPDILLFDMEKYNRHIAGTQAYMIDKTYAKKVADVVMKDTFQEMCESVRRQKYRFLDPSNNLLGNDLYIHHAFNSLVTFPPLAIEFETEGQNETAHWTPFFKGYESKREEYWKPGSKVALFTNGYDDYEQILISNVDIDIVCINSDTDTSVYEHINKVIVGSYTPKDPLTGKYIIRLVTSNPLIEDIERYTNDTKRTIHTPNEIWLKGNLEKYTSYLETLYSVPIVKMPELKPQRIPENPAYKPKAKETPLDIVIMEKNTNFNTSGWKALTICEQLYLQTPERINQVFFINTPKENPTSMGMIGSLKLKQDGKLRLFNTPTTVETIRYFLESSNTVVFLSNQIFDDMNYGYYKVAQAGFPLVHSSTEFRIAGIGRYYDSNNMLEAVGHLKEHFTVKQRTPSVPKLVHQTWETKDLPPAMKATVDYNKAQNPEFEFILYDDQDRIKFIETHFDKSVLMAYHTLVPGAYRADLFRYCVLYVLGGIYMDIRFKCTEGFHLADIAEPQYVRDIAHWGKDAIYNGIIVSNSNNSTLFDCIMNIVKHCENCYYGPNPLCITGPVLLGNYVKKELSPCIQMIVCETPNGITINKGDTPLLYTYKEYNSDKSIVQPYWRSWDLREVFGEVNIGTSTSDTKIIKLHKSYPDGWECVIDKHGFPDRFETTVQKDILTVKRVDQKGPWGWPHTGVMAPSTDSFSNYIDYFKVYHYSNKIRVGNNTDGGYVIADIDGYDCYISAGVSDDEIFSKYFIQRYKMPKAHNYAFDGTIQDYPWHHTTEINWYKKNISNINNEEYTNLSFVTEKYNNIFLKMDIEGFEYPWFLSLDKNTLKRFKQITLEFHGLNDEHWGSKHCDKIKVWKRLSETHYLIHAHGNNWEQNVVNGIPDIIEFTYIRKDVCDKALSLNTASLPSPGLDYPNHPYRPDIDLNNYPFVQASGIMNELSPKNKINIETKLC